MKVIILGAGAAGFAAAITAADKGASVTMIEQSKKPGKKILMTGNGKCNITNTKMGSGYYYGDERFINDILNTFGWKDTVEFFHSLGIGTKDKNGYIYPAGEQASTVLDTLRNTAESLGVMIKNNNQVEEINVTSDGFDVYIGTMLHCDGLVIATGGMSYLNLENGCRTGYDLAKELGHSISEQKPALTAVICEKDPLMKASGVRVDARVSLIEKKDDIDSTCIAEEISATNHDLVINGEKVLVSDMGQLQITDYGISGIPVFNISRMAEPGMNISIDFMPDFHIDDIKVVLKETFKIRGSMSVAESLDGMFNNRLSKALLEASYISLSLRGSDITPKDIDKLSDVIKDYRLTVRGVKGYDYAQVTAGGVCTDEICSTTMESKIVKKLYFAGEVIDVDGICGGYNLQLAWATGVIAGKNCVK